jgi:hypothetical protein
MPVSGGRHGYRRVNVAMSGNVKVKDKLVAQWECVITEQGGGGTVWCDAHLIGGGEDDVEFWELGIPGNKWTEGDVFYVIQNFEVAELIVEINELNATIFTLRQFPSRMQQEVRERYDEATKKRREAESKIEDWDRDSATDANMSYWEGQCHALAAIKRAMVI